jgi:hypothetical protein
MHGDLSSERQVFPCHQDHMFPFGLELAPSGKKVAGRSPGQFPNATLHVMKIVFTVSHHLNMSSVVDT